MATIFDMQPKVAFAGMKASSVEDTVVTVPCGDSTIPFGAICGLDANGAAVPGPGVRHQGVAIHSHAVVHFSQDLTNPYGEGPGYLKGDPISQMRRGEAWVLCKDGAAIKAGDPIKYGADGLADPAGANTLANAYAKDAAVQGHGGKTIVYVELHAPTA